MPILQFITLQNTVCDLLGCNDIHNTTVGLKPGAGLNGTLANFIRFGLGLVFVGIIALGIFLTIKAALTIIRSEGNESKIEEGTKAIKGVFIGIAIIVFGIVGIIVLLAFFQAGSLLNQNVPVPNGVNIPILTQ